MGTAKRVYYAGMSRSAMSFAVSQPPPTGTAGIRVTTRLSLLAAFGLGPALHVLAVGALVRLDVFELALPVPDAQGVEEALRVK